MPQISLLKKTVVPMPLILFVALFACFGLAALLVSRAAGPFESIEPEQGVQNAQASKITDAAASGGGAVVFKSAPTVPMPPGTAIFTDNFEGRGQSISTGTLINGTNGYVQNPNSSVPPVGWYPYGQHQSTFVLPQFDNSRKVSGAYSGRFGIRNQGSADGQDYTGGSYYMYRNDNNPAPKLHAYFWWQFDSGMSSGGGNCALYSAWTTAANDLTYLRFYGTGTNQGVLRWQAADTFQTSTSSATLQANTWYWIETTLDTGNDTSYATIKNANRETVSSIQYRMEASDSIRMFEFGALTARPYSAFPSAPGGGAYWYDDFSLYRQ